MPNERIATSGKIDVVVNWSSNWDGLDLSIHKTEKGVTSWLVASLPAEKVDELIKVLRRARRQINGGSADVPDVSEALSTIQSTVDTLQNRVKELEEKLAAAPATTGHGVSVKVGEFSYDRHLTAASYSVEEGYLYLEDTNGKGVATYAPGGWQQARFIQREPGLKKVGDASAMQVVVHPPSDLDLKVQFERLAKLGKRDQQ